MRPVFFLSYRREDAGYAEALRIALATRVGSDRVFKDVDSMDLGRSWKDQVAAAIARSSHVVVLVGSGFMAGVDAAGRSGGQTDPVVFELDQAFQRGVTVVPVVVGGAQMPAVNQLPAVLRDHGFSYQNAGFIRPESPSADIEGLANRLAPSAPPARSPVPQPPSPSPLNHPGRRSVATTARDRRRGASGAVVVTFLVVAVVAAMAVGVWLVIDRIVGGGGDPTLTLSPSSGPPGTAITATATGFDSGASITFRYGARPVVELTADGDGTATATLEAEDFPRGPVTISADHEASFDTAIFTVTG